MRKETRTVAYDEDLHIEAYRFEGIIQPFPNHFHEYYVIGYIESGERSLSCKTQEYTLSKGDIVLSHNHHFKWWFGLALIRAGYMLAQKGGYRKRCYWSAYKAVLLESSFLDSSACSLIYFFIASSVILPIVET